SRAPGARGAAAAPARATAPSPQGAAPPPAMARELAGRDGGDGEPRLDPRLSAEQRAAAEARLRDERHRRQQLLAALAVLDEEVRAPAPGLLEALEPSEIADPDAFGPRLARRRAGGPAGARAAFAPAGARPARHYFAPGSARPVLREDAADGDGRPDRWIAYDGDARSEVFESPAGDRPAVRIVFADGGAQVARVEVDDDGDGRPNRILRYRGGALSAETRDSAGDGRRATFDQPPPAGG